MSAVQHAFELATGPILTVAGAEPQARTCPGEAARAVRSSTPAATARVSSSRWMAERAAELRGTPWQHRGRLPFDGMDWLGFVRDCVQHSTGRPDLADALGYRASHDEGLTLDDARMMFRDWGLVTLPLSAIEPGEVLLFAMPRAHAGVVTAPGRFMHANWCRAVTESWLAGPWTVRMVGAFRLSSAAVWR